MQRRQVLAASTGVGITSLAGCLEDECPPQADPETPPEGWPVPGFDVTNTSVADGSFDGLVPESDSDDIPIDAGSIERWRVDLWERVDGEGVASAIVVDTDRVYIAYGQPGVGLGGQNTRSAETGGTVLAVDEATGDLEWEYEFSADASGAPALVGDSVLVGDADGVLRRLERATGDLRWKTDLESAVRTPAVADGWCYVQCGDGRVVAVAVDTGERCWTARPGGLRERFGFGDDYETAGRPAVTDDVVIVTTKIESELTAVVRVLERESGDTRWERTVDTNWYDPPQSPVVSDGTVFVAVAGRLLAYNMDGDLEWTFATGFDGTSVPAVDEETGTVYLAAKNAYAIDRETGEERWRHVNLVADISSVGSRRTHLTGTPAVAGDVVVVGFGALDREHGDHLWGDIGHDNESNYFFGSDVQQVPNGGPAVANGALYATTLRGRVVKIKP